MTDIKDREARQETLSGGGRCCWHKQTKFPNSAHSEASLAIRGEILGLSGGADFYGSSPDELRREFKKSLDVFLEVCKEQGIEPRRHYSGKFNLRIPPELHEKLAMTAEAQGKSLNSLAQEALQRSVTA